MDFFKYITWEELTKYIKDNINIEYSNIGLHPDHKGLGLNGILPFSLSEYEFNYMKDFIIKHNLKNGYELATGTGISTIAIGWALQHNGGKLLSMDSYIESEIQNVPIGIQSYKGTINNTYFENNKKLINLFNLDSVYLKKGWSPTDSEEYLKEIFYNEKIDFVFLDCPKDIKDFIRDSSILKDKLNDKFSIFVHDTFFYPVEEFNKISKEIFGIEGKQIHKFNYQNTTYNQSFPLSVITNIE